MDAPAPSQVPSQGAQTIKIPASSYEFGSILVDGPLLMIGKIFTDGRMTGERATRERRRVALPSTTSLYESAPKLHLAAPSPGFQGASSTTSRTTSA